MQQVCHTIPKHPLRCAVPSRAHIPAALPTHPGPTHIFAQRHNTYGYKVGAAQGGRGREVVGGTWGSCGRWRIKPPPRPAAGPQWKWTHGRKPTHPR